MRDTHYSAVDLQLYRRLPSYKDPDLSVPDSPNTALDTEVSERKQSERGQHLGLCLDRFKVL